VPLYLYVEGARLGRFESDLAAFTERHRVTLPPPAPEPAGDVARAFALDPTIAGAVIHHQTGWPETSYLRLARRVLRAGKRVWFYWPREEALESIDGERLRSLWRHWAVVCFWRLLFRALGKPPAAVAGDGPAPPAPAGPLSTGDPYKDQAQYQWDHNPVGSQYVKEAASHTLEWFLEVEAHRYGEYAPWMPEVMEFARHRGHKVLEIGGGMGTDLAQFAKHGAHACDVDLSAGHLALAQENFRLRGLSGRFVHHDAESLPFDDDEFDLVYSNGVLHHTPNTARAASEIRRVLKPGGRAIVMVYAENSLHYWYALVAAQGVYRGRLSEHSMGEIMSRSVEMTQNGARPLVKVYTKERLRRLFADYSDVTIVKRQLTATELPGPLRLLPLPLAGRLMGWNLVLKAAKPARPS